MYLHVYISGLYTLLPLVTQAATDPLALYSVVGLAVGWVMRRLHDLRGGSDA